MLKPVLDSLDAIPEAALPLYQQKDGKFHLAVEGMVPKERVDEFRTNNITLNKQLDELRQKFADVDVEAYKAMTEQQRKIKDKELIEAGKIEELFAERVTPLKTAYEKEISETKQHSTKLQAQLESLLIDGAIKDAAIKAGVRATAVDDVLLRGRQTFKLQDGRAVAFDGDKPLYGKTMDPVSVEEWVTSLADRAPHLFESSTGSGAGNARPNTAGAGTKRVQLGDNAAFLSNLQDIASRKVQVV